MVNDPLAQGKVVALQACLCELKMHVVAMSRLRDAAAFLVKEFNDPNAANGIRHAILTSAPKAADLILARAKAHHDSGIEYASMTLSEDHFRKVLGDIYRRCTAERNRMDSAPGADASASV